VSAPGAEPPLDVAQRALAHATGEAQVTVTRERSLLSRFARSRPTQATEVDNTVAHVLSVVDGQTGSASTNVLEDDALADAAARARRAAEAAARSGPGDYPGPAEPAPVGSHEGHDEETARRDPAQAGRALAAAFAEAERAGLEAFGIWTAGEVTTAVATSTGIAWADSVTDAYMKVIARDERGRSGFANAASVRTADIDASALAARAAAKVTPDDPATPEPGEYTAVLEPEAVGLLLEFLAYLGFDGLAHAEGRGAMVDRLGTQVAATAIDLADDPTSDRTLPRAFDLEGVPKARLPLIEAGVARAVTHDLRSAAKAGGGARSTGHALAPGGHMYGAFPTNLVMAGGDAADVDELVAPIERGIYVTRFWYVNPIHPRETLLTGMSREGTFLIEDGRISRPARDVRFTDSVLRILSATEALTREQRLVSEGEFYGLRFASGVVCPALRVDGFRVTGVKPE
jgi:predicted Zn-dependent protease